MTAALAARDRFAAHQADTIFGRRAYVAITIPVDLFPEPPPARTSIVSAADGWDEIAEGHWFRDDPDRPGWTESLFVDDDDVAHFTRRDDDRVDLPLPAQEAVDAVRNLRDWIYSYILLLPDLTGRRGDDFDRERFFDELPDWYDDYTDARNVAQDPMVDVDDDSVTVVFRVKAMYPDWLDRCAAAIGRLIDRNIGITFAPDDIYALLDDPQEVA